MQPRLPSPTASIRLAITGAIADKVAGLDTMARYVLTTLNRGKQFAYVKLFKLPSGKPTTNLRVGTHERDSAQRSQKATCLYVP